MCVPHFCSQEHVVKEDLLCALYCEFINRVNEVGVDVNKAIAHPHTQSLVQYVCGLGPRKGSHLLKVCVKPVVISKGAAPCAISEGAAPYPLICSLSWSLYVCRF